MVFLLFSFFFCHGCALPPGSAYERGDVSTRKLTFVHSVRRQRFPLNIMLTYAAGAAMRKKQLGIFEYYRVPLLKAKLKRPPSFFFPNANTE